jgi:hypothetical protein
MAAGLATKLASAANLKVSSRRLILLTPSDVLGFAALRLALAQEAIVEGQVQVTAQRLREECGVQLPPRLHSAFAVNLGATTATAVAAWINLLANFSTATENVSSASAALADISLMNLVAGKMPAGQVFVPSFYPPNVFTADATLQGKSYLADSLKILESKRNDLILVGDLAASKPKCKPTVAEGKAVIAQVKALSALVDTYESSLLAGSAKLSLATVNSTFSTPVPFQQLLSADLMLHQISADSKNVYDVALVHQLESGGTTLSKQSFFLGTRQYYSGGTVATFSLFSGQGLLLCSGVAYGYHGFIAAGDIGTVGIKTAAGAAALNSPGNKLPDVVSISSDCP